MQMGEMLRGARTYLLGLVLAFTVATVVAAPPDSSEGVFIIGDQMYTSGVIHDFSGGDGSNASALEETAANSTQNTTAANSTQTNGTRDVREALELLGSTSHVATAAGLSQSAGPLSFGSVSNRGMIGIPLTSRASPIAMPVAMLETDEVSWEPWDPWKDDESWEDDGQSLLVKEASEKADMMARDVDEPAGLLGETDSSELAERAVQDMKKKEKESPEALARKKAKVALKKVKKEEKEKLKKDNEEIGIEIKKSEKDLQAVQDKDDEFQSQDYSDDKKDSAKFKPNGTKLAEQWDSAMKPGPPAKPELTFPGTAGTMKRDEANGEAVPWPVKVGLIKNFPVNKRMVRNVKATLPDMHAVAVANIQVGSKIRNVAFVVHGHQLSRVDLDSGSVSALAGSAAKGFENGINTKSKFNDPRDVAVFNDPKNRDDWMVLVADSNNDQLRLVRDPLGLGNTTTVLENATVEVPRKVVVVESRQNTPEFNSTNARKVFAFLICGKRTVVRVENILGRRKVVTSTRAYESEYDRKERLKNKEIYNDDAKASVHLLSSGFLHLTDIAVLKENTTGSERIVAFVIDKEAGKLFRLERIIAGERQARVVEVGSVHNDVGPFEIIRAHKSWFGITGHPGKDRKDQLIHRMDQVSEGVVEGRSTLLYKLKEAGRVRSFATAADWKGKFYMVVDSQSSAENSPGKLIEVDTSLPLVCKDKTLLGSLEFNELGELQHLGLVKQDKKQLDLTEWVGMTPVANQSDWQTVLFRVDAGSVCGVGFTIQDLKAGVFGYHCAEGECLPT